MPPEIQRLTDQFLQGPVRIEVSRPATAAATITQVAFTVPGGDWSKRETLRRLVREHDVKNAIVFCNRKRDVDVVAKSLSKHGFSAAPLHGDLDQSVRTKTLESFRNGEIRLLVASDVAARGLDIPSVSHIFNFDVPFQPDDYVHRIGRTGRAGRTGHAFMLVNARDEKNVSAIEKLTGQKIERRIVEGLPEEEPQREGRRSERGRGAARGGRDRGRHRESHVRKEDHPRAHRTNAEHPVTAEAPVAVAAKASQAREERAHKAREPREARHSQPERKPASNPAPKAAESSDASQLPAFLLRPVRFPAKTAKTPTPQS